MFKNAFKYIFRGTCILGMMSSLFMICLFLGSSHQVPVSTYIGWIGIFMMFAAFCFASFRLNKAEE